MTVCVCMCVCVWRSPFLLCLSRSGKGEICQKFPCVISTQLHWCCDPSAHRDTKGKLLSLCRCRLVIFTPVLSGNYKGPVRGAPALRGSITLRAGLKVCHIIYSLRPFFCLCFSFWQQTLACLTFYCRPGSTAQSLSHATVIPKSRSTSRDDFCSLFLFAFSAFCGIDFK